MLGVWSSLSGFRQTYFVLVFSRSFFYVMPLLSFYLKEGDFLCGKSTLNLRRWLSWKKAGLNKQKSLLNQGFFLSISMPPAGIEPATHGLRVRCSASWAKEAIEKAVLVPDLHDLYWTRAIKQVGNSL